MGHKSGHNDSGAQGLVKPLVVSVADAFAESDELDVRALAAPHRSLAIDTLVKTCRSRTAPHTAKNAAAKSLLEFSDGRPSQIEGVTTDQSIHIHINRLYAGGANETRVIDAYAVSQAEKGQAVVVEDAVEIPITTERS